MPDMEKFWEGYIKWKNERLGYPGFDPAKETFTEFIERVLREEKVVVPEPKMHPLDKMGLALFRKISDFFLIMWERVWETFRTALSGIIADVFSLFFKELLIKHSPGITDYFKKQISTLHLPESASKELTDRLEDETSLGRFALFFFNILATGGKMWSIMSASHEVGRQRGYAEILPSLPGLGEIFMAGFRDPKYEPVIDDYMKRMGYNVTGRDMLKLVRWLLLNPDEVRQLYLRGEISKDEKDKRLSQVGIRPEDIEDLEKLYYFIPSPSDLVRFSVREAFDEAYIRDYNLMLDYPKVFEEWAKKQGVSEYWAKKFWVSHWVLPSIGQGYEMLHRGEIKRPELESLFKALDIMPYWRDKLLAISYSPYTRVDVRRMYRAGVLTKEDVYNNYKDLGYDDDRAGKLTAFTVKDALESERDLTKTDILAGYQRRTIDRGQAERFLLELKYSKDEAGIFISRVDYDTAKKVKDKKLSWIRKNYIADLITTETARDRLAKLNLKGAETNELFSDWDIEKDGRMTELTFKQLQQLFIEDVITEAAFIDKLKKKKYSDEDIPLLLKLTQKGVVEGD